MKRKFASYPVSDMMAIKAGMLNCAKQFNIFCLLDNHQYDFSSPSFECMIGAGVMHSIEMPCGFALEGLERFRKVHEDWIFGHFSYDLKNEIEELTSEHPDGIGFPDLFFFVPRLVVILGTNELHIGVIGLDADEIFKTITAVSKEATTAKVATEFDILGNGRRRAFPATSINSRFSKSEYIETINKLKAHILRGDCYEVNFCQEFTLLKLILIL